MVKDKAKIHLSHPSHSQVVSPSRMAFVKRRVLDGKTAVYDEENGGFLSDRCEGG